MIEDNCPDGNVWEFLQIPDEHVFVASVQVGELEVIA